MPAELFVCLSVTLLNGKVYDNDFAQVGFVWSGFDSCVLFEKWSKSVHEKGRRNAAKATRFVYVLAPFGSIPAQFFHIFCDI